MPAPILPPHKSRSAPSGGRQWGFLPGCCLQLRAGQGELGLATQPRQRHPHQGSQVGVDEGGKKIEQEPLSSFQMLSSSVSGLSGAPSFIHSSNTYNCCMPAAMPGTWRTQNEQVPFFHPLRVVPSSRGTGDHSWEKALTWRGGGSRHAPGGADLNKARQDDGSLRHRSVTVQRASEATSGGWLQSGA